MLLNFRGLKIFQFANSFGTRSGVKAGHQPNDAGFSKETERFNIEDAPVDAILRQTKGC